MIKNLNDWRVYNDIQYEWDTALGQAILEELKPKEPNRFDLLVRQLNTLTAEFEKKSKDW